MTVGNISCHCKLERGCTNKQGIVAYILRSNTEVRATSRTIKKPVLVDANNFFECTPGVEIEGESAEDIVHENDIDKDQEIVQEIDEIRNEGNVGEGAYITETESISDVPNAP